MSQTVLIEFEVFSNKKEDNHADMPQTEKINTSAANSTTQTCLGASNSVKYGELVILGYNGCLFNGDKGRRRSKFQLFKRQVPNGVKAAKHHIVNNPQQSELIQNCHQHSVSYTLSRSQAVIVEYDPDCNTDMFQIGRSSEEQIDFVVMDTIPGTERGDQSMIMQSTISRYACRILVDRTHPYAARIYAAGFDNGKNIFLGEKATKWYTDGEIDGLTTNGILIMHPINGFTENSKTGLWRELSVEGGLYALRESRSAPNKGNLVSTENNVLKDGTLIDLCGATLVWRSNEGLVQGPTLAELEKQIEQINASRPQCPVGLNTLVLPCKNSMTDNEKAPYVYLKCGHVHGQHSWGKGDDLNNCTCPMCREVGPFVKLQLGEETSFYNGNGIITHCFSPCGHMASEKTVKYWSTVQIPHGCLGFQPACPFCATVLNEFNPWVRLIFQDNMD